MLLFFFTFFLGFITLVLLLSNFDPADFHFFHGKLLISKSVIIILSILIGIFFTSLWQSLQTISTMRIYREFSRKITDLEEEIKKKNELLAKCEGKPEQNDEHVTIDKTQNEDGNRQ